MAYQEPARRGGDSLDLDAGDRPFDLSATAWLVGQGVRYLNSAGEESDHAYKQIIELLGGCDDAVETVIGLIRQVLLPDVSLRWSLLYLLGDLANPAAADFLLNVSIDRLPEVEKGEGCESPRDGELLVRTMAVEALQRIAARHPDSSEHVLKIVAQHPTRPILIEAVKAAIALGLKDKVVEMLSEDDRWIVDMRPNRIEDVHVDPERKETGEIGFAPPKGPSYVSAPIAERQQPRQEG